MGGGASGPMEAFETWLLRRVAQDVEAAVWDCDSTG